MRRRPPRAPDGRTACLLIGHGSRVRQANLVLERVARSLRRRYRRLVVEACYLEAAEPDVQRGIERCVARGARRILFVPYFLYLGGHVGQDLPGEIARARGRHPGLEIRIAKHLGYDRRLVLLVGDRIQSGLRRSRWV